MSDQSLPCTPVPNIDVPDPDEIVLAAYRDRTLSMLRRYARAAVELGRLPSLLGREFFRAKVTSYTVQTFEDAIIFAFDMERCIEQLTPFERTLLARLALQQYTQEEIARVMRIDRANVQRRFFDAVDRLTEISSNTRCSIPCSNQAVAVAL
jgi:DNA-directed RNA polymerase specialized sigma24 family protein